MQALLEAKAPFWLAKEFEVEIKGLKTFQVAAAIREQLYFTQCSSKDKTHFTSPMETMKLVLPTSSSWDMNSIVFYKWLCSE